MEKGMAPLEGNDGCIVVNETNSEDPIYIDMETEQYGIDSSKNGIQAFASDKGEGSNVVFSREGPLVRKESRMPTSCSAKKLKSRVDAVDSNLERRDKVGQEKKLSRQDRIELGRMFQGAVSSHDWEVAESLILVADPQTLNDALCITLDSIWFLSTHEELYGITELIKKIIVNGAYDFTRAALRTSFLASCVSACQSRTMSLADTVTVMAQRLHERLQECNGDEVLKAEAAAKLQLSAFKAFIDLAGNQLSGKDFTEAFDAACFPLTLFSSSFDSGWASGISATAIQGLLGMLVEGGADNVNQCFLEASRFGSTELVRILLQ
ncbi:hypothetical protein C1H46_042647 [Malus baccata]|uniref:Ankyrin repeat protein SKIP35 n=1 Tax=Malus baccata TaxID=106549 RepID=A0A540KC58_MALBA|nr:hypothetical protein C1H46_042647 [Malus baccata]